MRVTTFLRSAGEGSFGERKRHVLKQFHQGVIAEGADARLVDEFTYEPTDVAVVFGGRPSAGHEPTERVRYDIWSRHRGPFVLLETPLLGRTVYRRSRLMFWMRKKLELRDRKRCSDHYDYYRVGINGVFQDDADFNNRRESAGSVG